MSVKKEISQIKTRSHVEAIRISLGLLREEERKNNNGIGLFLEFIEYELQDIERRLDGKPSVIQSTIDQELQTRSVQDESGMADEEIAK